MTVKELQERQSWSLYQKIDHSLGTIESFVNHVGSPGKCYVSFSGGKDSTVLLHLVRKLYKDIPAVFINTGNEWPEIMTFVNAHAEEWGVTTIRPKLTPRQVWAKYGFPLISKETSKQLATVKRSPQSKTAQLHLAPDYKYKIPYKWRYIIHEPYMVSNQCCEALKKRPAHKYEKQTGRWPIIGVMADESLLRRDTYIRNGGCNVYNQSKGPQSFPLSIWLEKDIWDYINLERIPVADIYHKGCARTDCVGCGFGVQFKDDRRLQLLHDLHPKYYSMVMDYTNNGVPFRDAVRKMLSVNNLTLPDEK